MKALKVVSTILLLSSVLLINYNSAEACEAEQSSTTIATSDEKHGELVTVGFIDDNIELKMDKNSLESLDEGEQQRLLSYAVEIITNKHVNEAADSHNGIASYSTTGTKVVHTNHSCSPSGPYLLDQYYRVAYFYDTKTGKVLGQTDFYICGQKGTNCTYLASVTTYY